MTAAAKFNTLKRDPRSAHPGRRSPTARAAGAVCQFAVAAALSVTAVEATAGRAAERVPANGQSRRRQPLIAAHLAATVIVRSAGEMRTPKRSHQMITL
jgi:hypothetical protein